MKPAKMAICHPTERNFGNGLCKNCYSRQWRLSNPEKTRIARKASDLKHAQKIKDRQKVWQTSHPEHVKAQRKRYRTKYRDRLIVYLSDWRKKHPSYMKQWHAENPDKRQSTQYFKEYYRENKVMCIAKCKAYHKKHPECKRATECRRRAAVGRWTGDDLLKILLSQNYRCYWCCKELAMKYEVDHIIPLSKDGTNWPENVCVACQRCNRDKSNRMPLDFAIGLLK